MTPRQKEFHQNHSRQDAHLMTPVTIPCWLPRQAVLKQPFQSTFTPCTKYKLLITAWKLFQQRHGALHNSRTLAQVVNLHDKQSRRGQSQSLCYSCSWEISASRSVLSQTHTLESHLPLKRIWGHLGCENDLSKTRLWLPYHVLRCSTMIFNFKI